MAFTTKGLISALFFTALSLVPAVALDLTNVAFIQTSQAQTSIPVGHLEFCRSRPAECATNTEIVSAVTLTDANWQQLVAVNAYHNETIVPVTDEQLYGVGEFWTYPNGYGDCEDFALIKRRDLIAAGWPPSALLISVVQQANGDGHAVLLVRTDRGDMVLDNQHGEIRLWSETPYKFLKRQSQAHAGQWVDMYDDRVVVVAAN